MRFRIELAGEHSEGHEGRSALETITENARRLLVAQGFRPDLLVCEVDDRMPLLAEAESTTSADVALPEGDNGPYEDEEPEEGVVEESLEDQVARLYAELGSQAKVAKALGVTTYAVKRALR